MCTVSMIGDYYGDRFRNPQIYPWMPTNWPSVPAVSREEFDRLRDDVAQMKELLKRAKEYDERNNEPDCEIEDKMEVLRRVAKLVGIDLDEVISPKEAK